MTEGQHIASCSVAILQYFPLEIKLTQTVSRAIDSAGAEQGGTKCIFRNNSKNSEGQRTADSVHSVRVATCDGSAGACTTCMAPRALACA